MKHAKKQSTNIFFYILFGVLALVLLAASECFYLKSVNYRSAQNPTVAINTTHGVEGRYLFNGTIFWGRAIEKWSLQSNGQYDYAHPFSGLDTFERAKYDAWVADLECPVLDIVIPYQVQIDRLQFNCRPEYLAEAAKYFNIIDLANNHSGDKGLDGFNQTQNRVTGAGPQVFGNYDPTVAKDTCEVISLPVKLKKQNGQDKPGQLPVAFCAWHYFNRTPQPGEIETMKQYAKVMPVFAFVHMGQEYLTKAAPNQQSIAHQVIDNGADFVIANNPHWVQNSEVYKNKLIFYSTGNFIFDQVDSEGMRSASVDLTLNVKYDQNVQEWLDLAKQCGGLHDNCLSLAKTLTKPNYTLKYAVVAGDNTNRLTKKGDAALQTAIEERTNWAASMRELGQ